MVYSGKRISLDYRNQIKQELHDNLNTAIVLESKFYKK